MSLRQLAIGLVSLIVIGFSSCHDERKHIVYSTDANHTLLVYMFGDNSLSGFVDENLRLMNSGLLHSDRPLNLVIYQDRKGQSPELFQLKVNNKSTKVDTIYLKRWDEDLDSSDPKQMAEVIELTFQKFDSDIKGLEIWSHGMSWIPSDKFSSGTASKAPAATRSMNFVGPDSKSFLELWDLRNALVLADVHFDYMMFDACHMATAEVAYELRHQTDYLLASSTEIMGAGLPYKSMIQSLSTIQDTTYIESGLAAAFDDYQQKYATNGTFSLTRCTGMERLYKACCQLHNEATELMEEWRAEPSTYEKKIQHFGRDRDNARYYFYDLEQWVEEIRSEVNAKHCDEVLAALQECILCHYHSDVFTDGSEDLYISHYCGLALSVPEFWSISHNDKLDEAYSYIQWRL